MFNKSKMHAAGRSVLLTTTLVFCHAAPSAFAATGTWANSTTAAGNWSDTTKWVGGIVPTAAGDTANFNADYGTNNKVITIDTTSRTVGTLNIGDPGLTYRSVTIAASGGASLSFNNSGGGALLSKTTTTNTVTDVISAPVSLADNLTVDITDTTSGDALAITGVISESGGARSMTKNGSGILQFGSASAFPVNTFTGGFTLNAGEVQFFVSSVLGTGTLTINGGSLAARSGPRLPGNDVVIGGDFTLNSANAGGNLLTLTGAVDLGGSTRTITVDATGNAAISGDISNGGLTKAGTRTLTLSGTNTYTGDTTISAGTLTLTGSITSSVSVASGATFNQSVDGVIAGANSVTSSGTATLAGTNTYTGATTVNAGTLTLNGPNTLDSSSGVSIDGSTAKLVVDAYGTVVPSVTLTQGAVDGNGLIDSLTVADSVGNTVSAGAGADTYLEFDSLTFQGSATLNVSGIADVSGQYFITNSLSTNGLASVVVNATNSSGIWSSGVDYTVIEFNSYPSAVDASHFTLGTVSGLLGTQTAELVNIGSAIVLRITSDALVWTGDASPDWTTAPVGSPYNWAGGVEYANGNSVRFDDTTINTDVNLATDVSPGSVLVDNTYNDYAISSTGSFGILTGSLTKAGDGKLTLTTNNSFTGATTIIAGTIEISGDGSITSSSSITDNGELILNPDVSDEYANPITGSGAVTKAGTGTLTLSGANTFTGDFTLDAGLLNFNSPTALGDVAGTIVINGGSLDNTSGSDLIATANKAQSWTADVAFAGTNSLDMGSGTVTLNGVATDLVATVSANTLTVGEMKSATQGLVKQGAGTLVVTSTGAGGAASVLGGKLTLSQGTLQINRTDASSGGDFTTAGLSGSGTITNGAVIERWFFVNTMGSDTFSGNFANGGTGALGLIKQGIGTLTLTGANTYTGATTVENGLLNVQNGSALGGSTVSVRTLGGGLQLQGGITVPNNFLTSNDGTGASGYAIANVSGDNTITGTITLRDGAGNTVILSDTGTLTLAGQVTNGHTSSRTLFLQGASAGANTVSGVISNGTNTTLVTKRGTGVWTLAGVNTYTGATSVLEGTLAITGSLGNTAVAVSGGTLNLQNASAISQNTVTLSSTGLLAQTVVNAISGTSSVVIQTPTTLGTANNYSGDTTINAGTSMPLTITNSSAAGTGRLNAASGATTPVFNLHIDGGGAIVMPNSFGGNSGIVTTIDVNNNGSGSNGLVQLTSVGQYGNGTLNVTGGNGYNLSIAGFANNGGTAGMTVLNPTTANLTLGTYSSTTNFAKTLQLDGTSTGNAVTGAISDGTNVVSVTKANASTWTLSGTNTYTGDTTVEAGILALSGGNAIVDTGKLVINGGQVNPSGSSETVDTLYFGATQQAAGTWGATGSGATHIDDTHFTGTGVVTVTNGPAGGYSTWAATNAPTGTAADDYDGDGVSNGVEYLLGGTASTNDLGKLPTVSTTGGNLVFTFYRDQDSKTSDVAVSIQVGTTLASWPASFTVGYDTASSSAGVTVTDHGDGTDEIILTVAQAPDAKKFARLVVMVN